MFLGGLHGDVIFLSNTRVSTATIIISYLQHILMVAGSTALCAAMYPLFHPPQLPWLPLYVISPAFGSIALKPKGLDRAL